MYNTLPILDKSIFYYLLPTYQLLDEYFFIKENILNNISMHMFNNNREYFDKFISSINKIISLSELAIFLN
jgi:hypothetical protein